MPKADSRTPRDVAEVPGGDIPHLNRECHARRRGPVYQSRYCSANQTAMGRAHESATSGQAAHIYPLPIRRSAIVEMAMIECGRS